MKQFCAKGECERRDLLDQIKKLRQENKKLQEQFWECNANFVKLAKLNERLLKKLN